MRILLLLSAVLFTSFSVYAQQWIQVNDNQSIMKNGGLVGLTYKVDLSEVNQILAQAPKKDKVISSRKEAVYINVPLPDGTISEYEIYDTNLFGKGTLSQYSELGSYTGFNTKNKLEWIKITTGHRGLSFMIEGAQEVFIDAVSNHNSELYHVYYEDDYRKANHEKRSKWSCGVEHEIKEQLSTASRRFGDGKLRTFVLALSCTGEYAKFHGGTIPVVLDAYNVAMTRVNGVYEREFSVTMVFIDSVEKLINLDENTDPFTNDSGEIMLGENDTFISDTFGNDSHDIGHVFSTGGGGIAFLGSVCGGSKNRGVTGQGSPINDPFTIDYVAHEMGHQFGANHTQNNECNRVTSTSMEPGSASTIMGYAGICSPNVQNNSDDYFHAVSHQEITNHLISTGNCPTITEDGNSSPIINNDKNLFNIPVNTPFILTGEATDVDSDTLTYCWEQMDPEVADMPPVSNNTKGPAFRSNNPTTSPERYLPTFRSVLDGETLVWEVLSTEERNYEFNLTVRDNNLGSGNTADYSLNINTIKANDDFIVTYPIDEEKIPEGATRHVTWNIAGTDQSPINVSHVDIYISTNSGNDFELVAENVPNNGSASVTFPAVKTLFGKVMVKAVDNIFYNVNDGFFTIDGTFDIEVVSEITNCEMDSVSTSIEVPSFGEEEGVISLEVINTPTGINAEIIEMVVDTDTTYFLTLTNLLSQNLGSFDIGIKGTRGSEVVTRTITVNNYLSTVPEIIINLPLDGSKNVSVESSAEWNNNDGIEIYDIQVATNPDFSNPFTEVSIEGNSFDFQNLENNTVYYWRVRSTSPCFTADWGTTYSFQTKILFCDIIENNMDTQIPNIESVTESMISVTEEIRISDMQVHVMIDHSYSGDIGLVLISPSGERIELLKQIGSSAGSFGCDGSDIDLTFFDSADNPNEDLDSTCESPTEGNYQPFDLFSSISVDSIIGDWILEVTDRASQDGGVLTYWSISNCSDEVASTIDLRTSSLAFVDSLAQSFSSSNIFVNAEETDVITYTVKSLPVLGILTLSDELVEIGTTLTQDDINNGNLVYAPLSNHEEIMLDQFLFDVSNTHQDVIFNQPALIILGINQLTIRKLSVQDPLCYQSVDGAIEVIALSGEGTYSFRINGGDFQDNGLFTDLAEGTYLIEVQDEENTLDSIEITLVQPAELILSIQLFENNLEISTTGGTGPYSYSINGGEYSDATEFTLDNGNDYSIKVIDDNGCEAEEMVSVNYIEYVNFFTENVSCYGENDGTFSLIEIVGGTAPYDTTLSLDDVVIEDYNILGAGTYLIEITDATGNAINQTFEIIQPSELTIEVNIIEPMIEVLVTGGTPPYMYSYNGGEFTMENQVELNLSSDVEIIVIDNNGCEIVYTITDVIELGNHQLNILPNPSTDVFKITGLDTDSNLSYQVINLGGKLIVNDNVLTSTIDLSEQPDGIYILQVRSGKEMYNFKLIKIN